MVNGQSNSLIDDYEIKGSNLVSIILLTRNALIPAYHPPDRAMSVIPKVFSTEIILVHYNFTDNCACIDKVSGSTSNDESIDRKVQHVSFSSGSSQYNFVKNDLTSASQNSNIKWIIVYLHKEFYTSPNTCSSSSCSNTGSTAKSLRSTYHAMFDKYGVDVVLQGHVHNYQRTYPVTYDGTSSPTITSSSSTNYNDPKGEIFVIVGTGGVNFHALSGKASFVKTQQDKKFGALNIVVTNNGYKLLGQYYSNGGSKLDEFSITKTGTSTLATTSTAGKYVYGPSLTLSGEDSTAKNGENTGKQTQAPNRPTGPNGQGKGLDCAHFTHKGPVRCR